jgi:hypothetical protein
MKEGILIALIGAAGIVVGASIRAFGPGLLERIRFRKSKERLDGAWDGVWDVNFPDKKKRKITDVVHLASSGRGTIKGHGEVQNLGKYVLVGKESHYCIALAFNGVAEKKELAGVVLLKKLPGKEKLEGRWVQLDRESDLIGGTVSLQRRQ